MKFTRRHVLISFFITTFLTMNSSAVFAADALPKVALSTSMGDIVVELYPEAAPKTVANFLANVKSGHYNGTIFHRVINNFMIQGGGFDKKMSEKPVKKHIPLEAAIALEHGIKNDIGTIAMARTNDPDSAAAQFFINVKDNDFLNHQVIPEGDPVELNRGGSVMSMPRAQALIESAGYTPFGKIIQGMDVVEKMKAVETTNVGPFQNVPTKLIVIESAKIIK